MIVPYRADIVAAAKTFGLEPKLVAALVVVESGGSAWAWNPEPRYRYFWNVRAHAPFRAVTQAEVESKTPPLDFLSPAGDADQEWWAQQASWGLMQVMGAVARELGFVGPYLTELCDPTKNLVIGCRQLQRLVEWADGDATRALAAYNGGKGGNAAPPYRNQAYADRVLGKVQAIEV